MTTAAPVTMSDELEGKLISLAADILIDNLVQGEEQGQKIKVCSFGERVQFDKSYSENTNKLSIKM